MKGAAQMFTVSLVTYRHRLSDISAVVKAVLASGCTVFYVVDNSSMPELAADLAALGDSRIIYIPSENRGFGAGHNLAVNRALAEGCDQHFIVNPDIDFVPGTMEKITGFMAADRNIGLVMPETLNPDGSLQHNCKLVPSPVDLIFKRFLPEFLTVRRMKRFMMKDFDHRQVLEVPYLCGCFMAFDRNALEKAGLFDERFFMYPEDIDITRRIYSAGFRTVCYPEASVIHGHEQASAKKLRMLWVHVVNMIRYFNKWGWIFDSERRRINREIAELNKSKRLH